jgi:integrase
MPEATTSPPRQLRSSHRIGLGHEKPWSLTVDVVPIETPLRGSSGNQNGVQQRTQTRDHRSSAGIAQSLRCGSSSSKNPFRSYQMRRKEPRIVDILDEVLRRLMDLPDRSTYAGLRSRAFILLTLHTGIRPSEGRGLLPTDIDLSARTVTVRQAVSKTDRSPRRRLTVSETEVFD